MEKKKATNECLFCGSRFCHERVVSYCETYDEVACSKHVKDLHKDSNKKLPNIMKSFISSTGFLKRFEPFN